MSQSAVAFPPQLADMPAAKFAEGDRVVLFRVAPHSGTSIYVVTSCQRLADPFQPGSCTWFYQFRLQGPTGELVGEPTRPIAEALVTRSTY